MEYYNNFFLLYVFLSTALNEARRQFNPSQNEKKKFGTQKSMNKLIFWYYLLDVCLDRDKMSEKKF